MQNMLIEELVKSYREALENGGADKIAEILKARKQANVEADEMNNNEIAVDATLNLSEKTKFTFKGESLFTLNFEQQELPMGAGNKAAAAKPAEE